MILVTGATGLVGSHLLVRLLRKNETVKALYRTEHSLEAVKRVFRYYNSEELFDRVIWVKADITDVPMLSMAFENIRKVYHCAALISFDPKDESKLLKINVEGTANIVNCCIDFKVEKLCYVSSIAALGDTKQDENIITEETEWNAEKHHCDYALSKHGAEMEVWRGQQEGLQTVIVNPGVIFGFGFPEKGSGVILQSIKKGRNIFFTRGTTGVVAVEDVTECMIALMSSNIIAQRFTLVAENLSFEELLNHISDALGKKRPFVYAPPLLTSFACCADWLVSAIFQKKRTLTKAIAKSLHATDQYSSKKIKNELGFSFVSVKDVLSKIVKED